MQGHLEKKRHNHKKEFLCFDPHLALKAGAPIAQHPALIWKEAVI